MPFRETAKKNADKPERSQRTRVPRNTRTKIIAALKADHDTVRVARKFGLKRVTVWHIGRAAGIRFSGRRLATDKRAKIVAALKINPSARQVARQVGGVSHAHSLHHRQSRRHITRQKPRAAAGHPLTATPERATTKIYKKTGGAMKRIAVTANLFLNLTALIALTGISVHETGARLLHDSHVTAIGHGVMYFALVPVGLWACTDAYYQFMN